MNPIKEVLLVLVLFTGVFLVYQGQPRITLNDGQGFDGPSYYQNAQEIVAGNHPVRGELPFVKRIGASLVPAWITMATGMDLLDSAMWMNLVATLLTAVLLALWLREMVRSPWFRLLLVLLFLLSFRVTLRSAFWYPMVTDGGAMLFLVAALLFLGGMQRAYDAGTRSPLLWRTIGFSLMMGLGMFFRETHVLLALVALLTVRPVRAIREEKRREEKRSALLLAGALARTYATPLGRILLIPILAAVPVHLLIAGIIDPQVNPDHTYLLAAMTWLWTKSLPMFLTAVFIAMGPVLLPALVPLGWSAWTEKLRGREDLWCVLLMAVLFGWIGGNDTERIFFVAGFPIVLGMIGAAMETVLRTKACWWLLVLLVLQTLAFRFWWHIPDGGHGRIWQEIVPVLTIPGQDFDALLLHSHFGDIRVNTIVFLEYMFLLLCTWLLLRNRTVRPSAG